MHKKEEDTADFLEHILEHGVKPLQDGLKCFDDRVADVSSRSFVLIFVAQS